MYHTKQEIKAILLQCHGEAMESGLKLMSTIEEAFQSISNGDDIVGYFWMSLDSKSEIGMKLNSRVFMRIEDGLFTDDRFAIDLLQAQKEGKTVGDIVRERNAAQNEKDQIDRSEFKGMLLEKFANNG